jgi:hypothetical protein
VVAVLEQQDKVTMVQVRLLGQQVAVAVLVRLVEFPMAVMVQYQAFQVHLNLMLAAAVAAGLIWAVARVQAVQAVVVEVLITLLTMLLLEHPTQAAVAAVGIITTLEVEMGRVLRVVQVL